jgi:hypothetical protein
MQNKISDSLNGLYFLQPQINYQQLTAAIGKSLCKAEALAAIATIIDFEIVKPEIYSNYFWALSDIIQETKWLYEKTTN